MQHQQTTATPRVRFSLGRICATHAFVETCKEVGQNPLWFIARHAQGDWGELDPFDVRDNEYAITKGLRILSAYTLAGERVYCITEADRSFTTLMLADEY